MAQVTSLVVWLAFWQIGRWIAVVAVCQCWDFEMMDTDDGDKQDLEQRLMRYFIISTRALN